MNRILHSLYSTSATLRNSVLLSALVLLQACSGGSGGGGSQQDPAASNNGNTGGGGFTYSGPSPANSEIQSFKREFYDNLVIEGRCGDCHTTGGSAPTLFVDKDDVNNAWQQANTVVNLDDPAASTVVQRVANGHNCWLANNATCSSTMVGYITNWASGRAGSTTAVQLLPRTPYSPSGTKNFPDAYTDTDFSTGPNSLHGLLTTYCSDCHTGEATFPQSPYFASANPQAAYEAAQSKIDLINPANSRLVVRLRDEQHRCWDDCASNAEELRLAIVDIADDISLQEVDSNLLISMAQVLMTDGILATSGGRYEDDVIAEWKFSEGINPGDIADCIASDNCTSADTSGIQPEIVLSLGGDYELLSSGGVRFTDGYAQALASSSAKLRDTLAAVGEYSIEAWVAPANVTQEDSSIISYSGLSSNRNFTVGQTLYNYDYLNRSSATDDNGGGEPALSTNDDDERAQATLQHVVVTFDPVNGRRIFVNGEYTGDIDEQGGGNLSGWNETFSVVMGNDSSGTRPWSGILRYAAVHSRALNTEQIQQNYDVGIGLKYFLMFSVSEIIDQEGVCHEGSGTDRTNYCYVVFEVSQFDEYSYLFNDPFFVSLNEDNFSLPDISVKGIRIGINGKLADAGQAFTHVNTVVSGTSYTTGGQALADIGSILSLENGAAQDVFFLAFEEFNGQTGVVTSAIQPGTIPFVHSLSGAASSDIAVRTFEEINASFAGITGIASTTSNIHELFYGRASDSNDQGIKRQLPSIANFQTYQASHQTAVAQLAIAYCDALVEDSARRSTFFNNGSAFDFNTRADLVSDANWRDQVIYPLLNAALVLDEAHPQDIDTQPARDAVRDELLLLITDSNDNQPYPYVEGVGYQSQPDGKQDGLARCNGACPTSPNRTEEVVKAVCASVLGSAAVLLQ